MGDNLVFCSNCENCIPTKDVERYAYNVACLVTEEFYNFYSKFEPIYSVPELKNRHNNCRDFKLKDGK
jgi:hypothetical protein